ncbi:221_t:CDS:1, partial [Acaulospora colombiana]
STKIDKNKTNYYTQANNFHHSKHPTNNFANTYTPVEVTTIINSMNQQYIWSKQVEVEQNFQLETRYKLRETSNIKGKEA